MVKIWLEILKETLFPDFKCFFEKCPEYFSFGYTDHKDLYYLVCDQNLLMFTHYPAYHYLLAGSCIIYSIVVWLLWNFPENIECFEICFPLPIKLTVFFYLFIFPLWELIARAWIIRPLHDAEVAFFS